MLYQLQTGTDGGGWDVMIGDRKLGYNFSLDQFWLKTPWMTCGWFYEEHSQTLLLSALGGCNSLCSLQKTSSLFSDFYNNSRPLHEQQSVLKSPTIQQQCVLLNKGILNQNTWVLDVDLGETSVLPFCHSSFTFHSCLHPIIPYFKCSLLII